MLDCFSNLGLTVDIYHTKEEHSQKESKVAKFYHSKFHCIVYVLLVDVGITPIKGSEGHQQISGLSE